MTNASRQADANDEPAWRDAVAQWLKAAPGELNRVGFAQIDVDDLLGAEPPHGTRAAVFCMNSAVTDLIMRTERVEGLVVVPLEPRKRMTRGIPRLADVLSHPWHYGPGRGVPGIYLLTPAAWAAYESVEEYRVDLGREGLDANDVAYFRAWRSDHGDEFERAVYIRRVTA